MTRARAHVCFLAVLGLLGLVAVPAWGQEETTSAQDEVLSRYDSAATQEMAAEYLANSARREELDAEIEAAEDAGDWDRRSDLRDELTALPVGSDEADDVASARLADIAAAPLPDDAESKAAELRRKAQSADAVDRSLNNVTLNTSHQNYTLFGDSPAAKMSATYRQEAAALEVAAESEGAAREAVPVEDTAEETSEATAPAAPGDGGDEAGGEEPQEPAPEEVGGGPGVGTGLLDGLPDINIVPVLAFVALVAGGLFALSRSAGMSIRGFLSPAMASVPKKKKPAPKPKTKKPEKAKTKAATSPKPAPERPEIEAGDGAHKGFEAVREWREKEAPARRKPKPEKKSGVDELDAMFGFQDEEEGDDRDGEEPPD